jgi:hypothetical protein
MAVDLLPAALARGVRNGRKVLGEGLDGSSAVYFGPAVDEHPVRRLLKQPDLRFLGEADSIRRQPGALAVAAFQQHGEALGVGVEPARWGRGVTSRS